MNRQKETAEDKLRRTTCRACSNGWGDGCCSYHANKFQVLKKQIKNQNKAGKRA